MVEGETTTKDKTIEETVEIKRNYLSIPVMHYLRTTPLTKRARKDTL